MECYNLRMNFLSKLFRQERKGKSVIGVDIGSSSLKVVQLRREGAIAVLETYGELALAPYAGGEAGQATNLPADVIAESLNDLLREANVTTREAGVSIPFSRSTGLRWSVMVVPCPSGRSASLTV